MSKLYTTIAADLVDPDLEAKIDEEVVAEPTLQDIPDNLYAAITSTAPTNEVNVETEESTVKTFTHVVSSRLYKLIVPEKPSVLAQERIFVYVPKVSRDQAGIAKFAVDQFTIIDGEVVLKTKYLTDLISTNLLSLDIIIVVPELPEVGIANKLYLVPVDTSSCNGYVWNADTDDWSALGILSLNLSNYYTKAEVDAIIASIEATAARELQLLGNEPTDDVLWIKLEP